MRQEDNGAIFLLAFIAGAAVGAMAALVLAPTSGKKLRRDLAREGRRIAHRAEETAERIRDKGADVYEHARERTG